MISMQEKLAKLIEKVEKMDKEELIAIHTKLSRKNEEDCYSVPNGLEIFYPAMVSYKKSKYIIDSNIEETYNIENIDNYNKENKLNNESLETFFTLAS